MKVLLLFGMEVYDYFFIHFQPPFQFSKGVKYFTEQKQKKQRTLKIFDEAFAY